MNPPQKIDFFSLDSVVFHHPPSWWFQPTRQISVIIVLFPQIGMNIKPPPSPAGSFFGQWDRPLQPRTKAHSSPSGSQQPSKSFWEQRLEAPRRTYQAPQKNTTDVEIH